MVDKDVLLKRGNTGVICRQGDVGEPQEEEVNVARPGGP